MTLKLVLIYKMAYINIFSESTLYKIYKIKLEYFKSDKSNLKIVENTSEVLLYQTFRKNYEEKFKKAYMNLIRNIFWIYSL